MISSFTIGNFKAFGAAQTIPLKPITLIFGPNSAGKSSVLHSLLLAHEVMQTAQLDVYKTKIGGDSVDLGGFRQFTHRSVRENKISFRFDIPQLKSPASQTWDLADVSVTGTYGIRAAAKRSSIEDLIVEPGDDPEEPFAVRLERRRMAELLRSAAADAGDDPPALLSYEINVGGAPLLRASRKGAAVKIDAIVLSHPALTVYLSNLLSALTLATEVTEESLELAREVVSSIAEETELEMGGLLPKAFRKQSAAAAPESSIVNTKGGTDDARDQLRLILSFNFSKLVEAAHEEVSKFFVNLRYLGPLRSNPPRHLAFAEGDANASPEGAFAWEAVRDNQSLRDKVNAWLGNDFLQTKYQLVVDNLISSVVTADALETSLEEVISDKYEEWNEARGRMGEAEADEFFFNPYDAWDAKDVSRKLFRDVVQRTAANAVPELSLRDERNQTVVSHRDIGIGISQVLPVLVHAYGARDGVIAVEQPEIHLHPALQSELADVFIESAMAGKNTFILETHSEHLILRILRRIRETRQKRLPEGRPPLRPDDVSILYVQPAENGSEVRVMRIDDMGKILDSWPGGFFEESFRELF